MKKLKSKFCMCMLINTAGFFVGAAAGLTAAVVIKKRCGCKSTLKNKAKKAFKTIEDKLSM